MQLQTPIDIIKFPFEITHKDKIIFIGSCFAENIGQKFAQRKFDTLINPFGVLYNPTSVSHCIHSLLDGTFDETQLVQHDGIWHSFSHHGSFSNTDKTLCLDRINTQQHIAKAHLTASNYLFLTLGTAHVFEHRGNVVSNCHKLPTQQFTRRRLNVQEIVVLMKKSIKALRLVNPKVKIIFTLSPVRYPKDGMNANSLSKATLLLAIEELCQGAQCYYFPAYEIVLDELRDYRFFAEDMTHPNATAINYLWEKLEMSCFNHTTIQLCKEINKLLTATQHRPFNTNPKAHQHFLETMLKKASDLQCRHPELNLNAEIDYFSKK